MMTCQHCGEAFARSASRSWATGDGSMTRGVMRVSGPKPKFCSPRCRYNAWVGANPERAKAIEEAKRRRQGKVPRSDLKPLYAQWSDEWRRRRSDRAVALGLSPEASRESIYRRATPGIFAAKDKRHRQRRRALKSGALFLVDARSDECGVCFGPLDHSLQYPHPMSVSLGHEPPLATAARDGWKIVCERYEHLSCNLRKGDKPDWGLTPIEMVA